jgi:hypothetical protein
MTSWDRSAISLSVALANRKNPQSEKPLTVATTSNSDSHLGDGKTFIRFLGDGAIQPKMHVADPQGHSGFGGRFLLLSRRSSPTVN